MTLDQLRVLDAIARLGSFAAAGRELHRATSAVSYAVKALEDTLGVPLFDWSGHRAQLTDAGCTMLEESRRLLEHAARLEQVAGHLREAWEPLLEIVVDGILPMRPLMRAITRFSRHGLPTRVELHVEYLSGVAERFEDDGASLMFVLDFAGDVRLAARPLAPVEMRLLARPDHPVRAVQPVDWARLAEHVELMVEDSSRRGVGRTGRLALGSPHVFSLSDFHSKRDALLEGVGYGWMPIHLVGDDSAAGRLAPVGFEEGDRHVFVPHRVHRRAQPLGRAARLFLDLLDEEDTAARTP